MNKRNTIIIAVLINAALLTLLFITASSHEEEYYAKAHLPVPQVEEKQMETVAVLEPRHETPSSHPEGAPVPIPLAALPVPAPAPSENPVVYALPEVAASSPLAVAPQPAPPKHKEVVVKKGDSLDKIARMHKVSLEEIVKLNQLPNSFLRIGQVLKIPEGTIKTAQVKTEVKEVSSQFYVVKAGDNPWTIAMKHHMKVEELLRLNHLDKDKAKRLKPGDKLRVK